MTVCCLNGVMGGRLRLGCDNKKLLFLWSKKVQSVRQKRKHADILRVIRKVRTSISMEMEFNHVRGHK